MRSLLVKAIAFAPTLLLSSMAGIATWTIGNPATSAAIPTIFMGSRSAIEPMVLAQLVKRPFSISCLIRGCQRSANRAVLRSGTKVSTHYRGEEKVLQPGETRQLILSLDQPILDASGEMMLPASSLIKGSIVSTEQGQRFVAHQVTTQEKTYALVAEFSFASSTMQAEPIYRDAMRQTSREPVVIVPNQEIELSLTSDSYL